MNTKSIPSANDLSIIIHQINKKYNVKGFFEEYISICDSLGGVNINELEEKNSSEYDKMVFDKFLEDNKSNEDLITSMRTLVEKYRYMEYLRECEYARKVFFAERKDYFRNEIVITSKSRKPIFSDDRIEELAISSWIDSKLIEIDPNPMYVKYEDLDGKIKEVSIMHKNYVFHEDYIEGPMIDKQSGHSNYDSFVLHSFYNKTEKKWIYVPVKLIIKLHSPYVEELNEKSQKEDTKEKPPDSGESSI